MLTYATPSDYAGASNGDLPENIDALLRTASRLVRDATRTALYDTLPSGAPSDPDVAEAFRDATVIHAQAMADAGITSNPAAGRAALTGTVTSTSIGKASITRTAVAGSDTDRGNLLTALCADALWCLESAGVAGVVRTW